MELEQVEQIIHSKSDEFKKEVDQAATGEVLDGKDMNAIRLSVVEEFDQMALVDGDPKISQESGKEPIFSVRTTKPNNAFLEPSIDIPKMHPDIVIHSEDGSALEV